MTMNKWPKRSEVRKAEKERLRQQGAEDFQRGVSAPSSTMGVLDRMQWRIGYEYAALEAANDDPLG